MKTTIALTAVLLLQGCASIINGSTQDVQVESAVAGEKFTVTAAGKQVASGVTPAVVNLDRGAGFYRRAEYVFAFESGAQVKVRSDISRWFYGSILFEPITALTVDPATGGMYKLPEVVRGGGK